ncbi:DUF3168 domain-containing protein [Variovorax boronicumulans]|uniref:DUF3168 domain-containing protein n=1 Tax=Variovorax boronicumulans TaxID=436515 RepID=UPI001C588C96
MSLEKEIFVALKGLVPVPVVPPDPPQWRVYPLTFPQAPAVPDVPAIRYVFVSSEVIEDLCGDDGDNTPNTRTQIDLLERTFPLARALRLQVIAAMGSLATPTRFAGGFDDYDPELKLYRCSLDFISYPSS